MSSEVSVVNHGEEDPQLELPPGFRFHPTDEEVISHYLTPKVLNCLFSCVVIADVDLNKSEPWDLPGKAKMGEKEWYFFCHKDRKYPTGMRTNRATESGYWKATGKDKEIFRGRGVLVGMKKTLVFYLGRAPRGGKTPWVMHEYRLEGKLPPHLPRSAKDEWAVCRVFNKDLAAKNGQMTPGGGAAAGDMVRSDSLAFLDDLLYNAEMPPLMDPTLADVDFKGASTSGAAATTPPDMGYEAVKTKQPAEPQQSPNYFSLTATNSNSGAGHLHQAAMGDQAALRRHCKEEASALLSPSRAGEMVLAGADMSSVMSSSKQHLELEDLWPDYPHMDFSNMWSSDEFIRRI